MLWDNTSSLPFQVSHQTILVLDFGSQYTQLIARRLRELSVYSEIVPFNTPVEKLRAKNPVGIILSGGPKSVSEAGAPKCEAQVFDFGVPVLGICYGMQLLAEAAGGSFVYDIPSDRPGAGAHRLPEPGGRHTIEIVPGTQLAGLLGAGTIAVNSTHHQAVDAPGHGLRVSARAADGIVEAIEPSDPARFALGVQWHPERMDPAHRAALFGALCGWR
jgi:GMP synthase (glutamine-hydrolysing)